MRVKSALRRRECDASSEIIVESLWIDGRRGWSMGGIDLAASLETFRENTV